jgi:hypothetical protein
VTVTTVYSRSFSTGLGSWAAFGTGGSIALVGTPSYMTITAGTTSVPIGAQVGLTGLVIGNTYQFVATLTRTSSITTNTSVGVTGIGNSTPQSGAAASQDYAYTFIATATAHTLQINTQAAGTGVVVRADAVRLDLWQSDIQPPLSGEGFLSMTGYNTGAVRVIQPGATVTIDGDTVDVIEGSILLDAQQVPYGSYNLTIPLDDSVTPAEFDPRVKVPVTIGLKTGATMHNFDGYLRVREIDAETRTIRLEATTAETFLQDYAPVTSRIPLGPFGSPPMLREYVNDVLGIVLSESLESSPSVDKDMTPIWEVTNLALNPTARNNTTGWQASTNLTLSRITGVTPPAALTGVTTAFRGTTTASIGAGFVVDLRRTDAGRSAVTQGRRYISSVYVRCSVARIVRVTRSFYNSGNGIISSKIVSQSVAANTWTFVEPDAGAPVTAPAGAETMEVAVGLWGTDGTVASGVTVDVMGVFIREYNDGAQPTYFDGATTDTATYNYTWDDPAAVDASTSTRIPLVPELQPESLIWRQGVSAWDFLMPLVTGAGYRLYCDYINRWYLVDPTTRTVTGTVTADAGNIVRITDTVDRNDSDTFATGVVLKYMWTDAIGAERVAYDTAGTTSKVHFVEYPDTPFPGPGAAAAMLAKRDGTGQVQSITMLRPSPMPVSPPQPYNALVSNPEHITPTTGMVRAVRYDLTVALIDVQSMALDASP